MKQTTKMSLSYFRLKLESFLQMYHPEKMGDTTFIISRAEQAMAAYENEVKSSNNHLDAEIAASKVLFKDLNFSLYETIVMVLEQDFQEELPDPLPERLAPILLKNKAVKKLVENYHPSDGFTGSAEYEKFCVELSGLISLLIEKNNLSTVEKV